MARGDGSAREVRPGVWRAWRAPQGGTRASRTFFGQDAAVNAAAWARGDPEPAILYLGQWLERWLALRAPTLAPSSIVNYRDFILAVGTDLAYRPLADVGVDDWQARTNALLAKWSRLHVRAWKGIISAALRAAVERGHLDRNPLAGVRLPKGAEQPPKAWRADEVRAMLAEASGDANEAWLCLALGTGLRLGELRALEWTDVELQARTVTVARSLDEHTHAVGPTKSGRVRVVDLPDALVPLLVAQRARQKPTQRLVFGRPDNRPFHPSTYRAWLRRLCKRAHVRVLAPHSTRHTFVSLALDAGVPIQDLARALGHASIATTQAVYAHFIGDGQRRAANALGGILAPQNGGSARDLHAEAPLTR